ncbi:hypothetical protein EYB26_000139 [Talaromyces marneffei]|uniref:uncharacterized protein n=1 Tax=Talaromyces marneffei TaxID=37727 RepID=UPI0012A815E9|nr:uncharacterized protein EYB26_000139 [Talaromyces marneffei]QGA12495.1 hypothetical protein EYB26_000139 [Talaromyces marneffei]
MTAKDTKFSSENSVHPLGYQSSLELERLPLSLLGHVMPKIYVLIAEVFPLPESTDTEAIVKSMIAGLEAALSRFPILVGSIDVDAATGRMWVTKKRDSAVKLHVKYMLDESEFPSYEELAEKDFPASLIAGHQLLPESVTAKQLHSPLGDNAEGGIDVAAFQINFIRGGFILGTAVHHAVSDGPGCDGFLATWAENSAAAAKGQPLSPLEPLDSFEPALDVKDPTPERMADIKDAYPVLKDAGGPMPPPPADFKMPPLVQQMWHFPKKNAESLKALASTTLEDGWISTYDAVMGLIWSSVTRAKIDLLKPDLNSKALLINAINTRKVWNPPLSESFLGVAATPGRCEPLPLNEIIAEENLSKLAASVRSSIQEVTPQYLDGMLQWIAGHEDKRWLETSINSFLGMDLAASSWQGMAAYEKHDFGFGLPSALRWPSPPFDGFVFLYPSRADMKDAKPGEGIEVCVCLEQSCHERLMKDTVLLQYAHPRG